MTCNTALSAKEIEVEYWALIAEPAQTRFPSPTGTHGPPKPSTNLANSKERKDENSFFARNHHFKPKMKKYEHFPFTIFASLVLDICDVTGVDDDLTTACHRAITIHKT